MDKYNIYLTDKDTFFPLCSLTLLIRNEVFN